MEVVRAAYRLHTMNHLQAGSYGHSRVWNWATERCPILLMRSDHMSPILKPSWASSGSSSLVAKTGGAIGHHHLWKRNPVALLTDPERTNVLFDDSGRIKRHIGLGQRSSPLIGQNINICSDSRAAIQSLSAEKASSRLVLECKIL